METIQTSFALVPGTNHKLSELEDDGGPPAKKMLSDCPVASVKQERQDPEGGEPGPRHLSPGLQHTLAQFHLSSQSSLGGPAAFSARCAIEGLPPAVFLPLPAPPALPGPLLVPPDSSTELTQTVLEGEPISCFQVGGEKRLCLPQVLNSVLRAFSLQQINAVCDELFVHCSRCSAAQLHVLKALGVLPLAAPSCGLVTLTDAQRLCHALLRPRPRAAGPVSSSSPAPGALPPGAFEVQHECLGRCRGLLAPQLYARPDAPCIQCLECAALFAPQTFVLHSHRPPGKRTCHWGFEAAKWRCYLHVNPRYLGTPDEKRLKGALQEMKDKFRMGAGKRAQPQIDTPGMELQPWYPVIKQEDDHISQTHSLLHPSYYLYMCDKVVAPNVSLTSVGPQMKEVTRTELSGASPGQTETSPRGKQQKAESYLDVSLEEQEKMDGKRSRDSCSRLGKRKPESTAVSTARDSSRLGADHRAAAASPSLSVKDAPCEDDKGKIMEEVMRTYIKQQEKLNSILQKKQQLQMEVDMLSSSKAMKELTEEQQNLQKELESLQNEHAQRMEEFYVEQKDLEKKLEQVMKQKCTCDSNLEKDKEAEYAAQLAELRQRLDHAEADRQELQDELRQEREARQKLELMIKELKLQILKSSKTAKD